MKKNEMRKNKKLAEKYFKLAEEAFDKGDFESMRMHSDKAIQYDVSNTLYYVTRSRANYELKRYKEALSDIEMYLKEGNNQWHKEAQEHRSNIYWAMGNRLASIAVAQHCYYWPTQEQLKNDPMAWMGYYRDDEYYNED